MTFCSDARTAQASPPPVTAHPSRLSIRHRQTGMPENSAQFWCIPPLKKAYQETAFVVVRVWASVWLGWGGRKIEHTHEEREEHAQRATERACMHALRVDRASTVACTHACWSCSVNIGAFHADPQMPNCVQVSTEGGITRAARDNW
jgi:hypothetical protein